MIQKCLHSSQSQSQKHEIKTTVNHCFRNLTERLDKARADLHLLYLIGTNSGFFGCFTSKLTSPNVTTLLPATTETTYTNHRWVNFHGIRVQPV